MDEEDINELEDLEELEEEDLEPAKPARLSRTSKPILTADEQMRLAEVMLYCYFRQMEPYFGNPCFWETIKNVCLMHGIDSIHISKSVRLLNVDTMCPTDLETWYLLNKIFLSVRQIRSISGIYWQKQKKLNEELLTVGPPKCKPKIVDPALRKSIKDFIFAMYEMSGVFQFTDAKTFEKALC